MAGIFGEFFLVSVSHETKHENSSKISENSEQNSGQSSGRKLEKFGELRSATFLTQDIPLCLQPGLESHQESKDFIVCRTPQILWIEGKNALKSKEVIEKKKKSPKA